MKKLNLLLLTLVTLLALTSFSGNGKVFNNADKWIPADFDPRKTTLLIDCFCSSPLVKKLIEEHMQEKYPYKSVVANDTKDSIKYADKDLYRYVLVCRNYINSVSDPSGRSSYISLYDYHIWDRKLDKHYPETGKPSQLPMVNFRPMINTIVKFLSEK